MPDQPGDAAVRYSQLVRAAQAGDACALGLLLTRHRAGMRSGRADRDRGVRGVRARGADVAAGETGRLLAVPRLRTGARDPRRPQPPCRPRTEGSGATRVFQVLVRIRLTSGG